jgi:hypothetical protein
MEVKGYHTHLQVPAVPSRWSRIGIQNRFETNLMAILTLVLLVTKAYLQSQNICIIKLIGLWSYVRPTAAPIGIP